MTKPSAMDPSVSGILMTEPHMEAKRTLRETILEALDHLEEENEQLRVLNDQLVGETNQLKSENSELRQKCEAHLEKCEDMASQAEILQKDVENLKELLKQEQLCHQQEIEKCTELGDLLDIASKEKADFMMRVEELEGVVAVKHVELKGYQREVKSLNSKLDQMLKETRSNRDVELLHSLEMLKEAKADLMNEKILLEERNDKLSKEISNMQIMLDRQESELKNENRRHYLLTKEFNSLLEENNQLKQQLRRLPKTNPSAKEGEPLQTVWREPSDVRKCFLSTSLVLSNDTSSSSSPLTVKNLKGTPAPSGTPLRKRRVTVATMAKSAQQIDPGLTRKASMGSQKIDPSPASSPESLPSLAVQPLTWKP